AAAPGTAGWCWADGCLPGPGRSLRYPLQHGIDGITGVAPGLAPLLQHLPATRVDAVVAARRPAAGRLHMALQQAGALQVAQHRVQRALLATEHALAH